MARQHAEERLSKPPRHSSEHLPAYTPRPDEETHLPFHVRVHVDNPFAIFTIHVYPHWAPAAAERFHRLVDTDFYKDSRVHRFIPGFVAQFGLAAHARFGEYWRTKNFPDDPVKKSNLRGFVAFARTPKDHSSTTQIIINMGNNSHLDEMGYAPFGHVTEEDMKIIDSFHDTTHRAVSQGLIMSLGEHYLQDYHPELTSIRDIYVHDHRNEKTQLHEPHPDTGVFPPEFHYMHELEL